MICLNGLNPSINMIVDKERFENARCAAKRIHERFNIGTYKERSQHLILKLYYEPDTTFHEVPFCGHIADIMRDGEIIEIQTGSMAPLVKKLSVFLPEKSVKIVFPCAVKSRICWIDPESGESFDGVFRKYEKKRYSVLPELLRIGEYFGCDGFSVDLVMTYATVFKLLDGYGVDRKKRATKTDTVPDEISEIITLKTSFDVKHFLGLHSGEIQTQGDLAKRYGLKRRRLWMTVKGLQEIGVIEPCGKEKNKLLYKVL